MTEALDFAKLVVREIKVCQRRRKVVSGPDLLVRDIGEIQRQSVTRCGHFFLRVSVFMERYGLAPFFLRHFFKTNSAVFSKFFFFARHLSSPRCGGSLIAS